MEREILELYGPWWRHPDGRFVDWSELPEEEKERLRGERISDRAAEIVRDYEQ